MNPTLSFAPANERAIGSGGKYRRLSVQGDNIDAAEFGRVIFVPRMAIGYREAESVMWEEISPEVAQCKWSYTRPIELQ